VNTAEGWDYLGIPHRWVDGDTDWMWVEKEIDHGFRVFTTTRHLLEFRIWGCDTPERGKPKYGEATARSAELCPVGKPVRVQTFKPHPEDKYGRWLVRILLADGRWLDEVLIEEALAVPYFGGTR
jgi:endonuclease YncB( thermonuclease family)